MKEGTFRYIAGWALCAVAILLCVPANADKRKKNAGTAATEQSRTVTVTFDFSDLRDSVKFWSEAVEKDVLAELADSEAVRTAGIIAYLDARTQFKSLYSAASSSRLGDEVAALALEYLGRPYVWAANGPDAFDCSGFTKYIYKQLGVYIPRMVYDQYVAGTPIYSMYDLRKGDLVMFGGIQDVNRWGHVGIVIDVDLDTGVFYFCHASLKGVIVSKSTENYYQVRFKGACRIIPPDGI